MPAQQYIRKKGQIHLTETTLVVFIVIIIILLGIIFYYRVSISKVETLGEELSEREASIMLVKAMNLDEISCDREDCLDTAKFLGFEKALNKDFNRFKDIFGRKKIIVRQVYPALNVAFQGQECDVAHYVQVEYPNNCDTWNLYEFNPENKIGRKVSSIVSLYFPEFDEYRIGRLEIEYYGGI